MNDENTFEAGDTVIDLDEVSSFQDLPQVESVSNDEHSLVVEMIDGTETLIEGSDEAEAFVQAIDDHLGI